MPALVTQKRRTLNGNPKKSKTLKNQVPQTKQGKLTSIKMKNKLKSIQKLDDKDITDEEDAESYQDEEKKITGATEDLIDDPFFVGNDEAKETADEKRLRLTKNLINELKNDQKQQDNQDFFLKLQANTNAEVDILNDEDDIIRKQLKYKLLQQKDKLFYNVASEYASQDSEFKKHFFKGHKKAITTMEWLPNNKQIITGSKDCNLILWDIESGGKKQFFKGEKFNKQMQGHFDEVCCMAISPNGKYLISGGKDRIVRIWDIQNQKQIQSFMGHRDTITGVQFDKENDQFYTVSNDRSLKVWNIREMMYMDSHYGHQADIFDLKKYSRDRVMSCGLDRQVIFWKINEDSELLYRNPDHFTDTLNVINNHFFVTGSHTDNCLNLWIMNKKRPIFTLNNCHAKNSWLLSTDLVHNSDLMATGGFDGKVNLYKFNKDKKNIEKIKEIDGLQGSLNQIKFSNIKFYNNFNVNETVLAVSHSQEQKYGRWNVTPEVKEGISIITKVA